MSALIRTMNDSVKTLADYAALRGYAGGAAVAYVTGPLATAHPAGIAGTFIRDDSDTTSADDGATILVASNGKRWKRQFSGGVNVQWFGAKMDGTDDTAGVQAAINYVIARATAMGRPYGLPRVEIPGGRCVLTNSITSFPWVSLVALGPVVLDFSGLAANLPGIVCSNNTAIAQDALKFPADHAPFLNGQGGAIALLGPGVGTSTAAALRLGNFAAGGKAFRDARIANVVVNGWGIAQEFGQYDTYLFHADNCRFEGNGTAIKTQSGTNTNSGERMEWVNCTFANHDKVIDHNIDGFDVNMVGCSFDFNGDIVKLGANSRFCAFRLVAPYIESLDGYVVNGAALVGTSNANQLSVFVTDAILLPRNRNGSASVNSPSRTLFTGAFALSLRNLKLRNETRPYVEDGNVVDPTVTLIDWRGYHPAQYAGAVQLQNVANQDYDFQRDASGTAGASLSAWDIVAGSLVAVVSDLSTVGAKKVLRLIGTSGSTSSTVTLRSHNKIPARAGDVFYTNLCLNGNLATGNIGTQAWIEFFDDADVSLGTFPSYARYMFRDAMNDATVPNYATGGDRWMDTHAWRSVAPKNTAYGKMRWAVDTFDGTLYVSKARMWRDG